LIVQPHWGEEQRQVEKQRQSMKGEVVNDVVLSDGGYELFGRQGLCERQKVVY